MNSCERLALAIYTRDFDAAEAELLLLAATNARWAVATQRARNMVSPPAPLPSRPPFALPVPGATLGSMLGDDLGQRVRPLDPTYARADRRQA